MYAIICNARKGHSWGIETLALVDRNKSKSLWWISDNPNFIMNFKKYEVARKQLKRLKYNNVRIVHIEKAKEIIEAQKEGIEHLELEYENFKSDFDEGMDALEFGWDGHKAITGTGD